ncbi:SLAM family member 5-like [Pelobates cultripes]|uniref:SLAM family member 5-like n=1 Tax=Pelobates cultripes TaxID=61616 RepID=A0AAD1TGZ0_PELCU|nr:SLAM family member 5-like [Pelobates cultripes]
MMKWVTVTVLAYFLRGILCRESCGDKKTIFGAVGREVILPMSQTATRDITWMTVRSKDHFATTNPGEIDVRDYRYEGRLSATANGSLRFTNLTGDDQGEYIANILKGNMQCKQVYSIQLSKFL